MLTQFIDAYMRTRGAKTNRAIIIRCHLCIPNEQGLFCALKAEETPVNWPCTYLSLNGLTGCTQSSAINNRKITSCVGIQLTARLRWNDVQYVKHHEDYNWYHCERGCCINKDYKNPLHLDVVDRYPRRMGDKTIPDEAPPSLESFYPPWVAGIDLPQSRCCGFFVSFTNKHK